MKGLSAHSLQYSFAQACDNRSNARSEPRRGRTMRLYTSAGASSYVQSEGCWLGLRPSNVSSHCSRSCAVSAALPPSAESIWSQICTHQGIACSCCKHNCQNSHVYLSDLCTRCPLHVSMQSHSFVQDAMDSVSAQHVAHANVTVVKKYVCKECTACALTCMISGWHTSWRYLLSAAVASSTSSTSSLNCTPLIALRATHRVQIAAC